MYLDSIYMTINRKITDQAKKYLLTDEILLFIGARQAGKTTILKQLQNILIQQNQICYSITLEDRDYLKLLNESPKNIFNILSLDLQKKNYLIIDEIQYLDDPSNFLKYIYDQYAGKIKLLVSGSSAFYLDEKFKDSLAGRKKIFNVYTLSFSEFLNFKNESALADRIKSQTFSLEEKEKIILYCQEYMIYGGYPRVVLAPLEEKIEVLRDIAYSYIKKDIFEAGIRQEEIFYQLFKILSVQTGGLVNVLELANTLNVSKTAISHYLHIMQKSFHIHLLRPFFNNVRKELSKMPKIYFYDLGLRNFFVNNFQTYTIRADKGEILENMLFRQLLEKHLIDEIKFWRTTSQQEIDFIINGQQAWECKASPAQFKDKNYLVFKKKYPSSTLDIISFNAMISDKIKYPLQEVWNI